MADLRGQQAATEAVQPQVANSVVALLSEYFALKAKDKAIRAIRNEYMKTHKCLNASRPTTDFKDQFDYEDNGGECIHRTVGMGGYPAPLCTVCEKRNAWYTERQQLSHRRAVVMRKLKRLVPVIDLATTGPGPTTDVTNPPKTELTEEPHNAN